MLNNDSAKAQPGKDNNERRLPPDYTDVDARKLEEISLTIDDVTEATTATKRSVPEIYEVVGEPEPFGDVEDY